MRFSGQEEKELTEDEMVEWHHWLEKGFEQTGRQWRTGKPSMLQSLGSQRVGHSLATEQQHQRDFQSGINHGGFPGGSVVKIPPAMHKDGIRLIPGSGRSVPHKLLPYKIDHFRNIIGLDIKKLKCENTVKIK